MVGMRHHLSFAFLLACSSLLAFPGCGDSSSSDDGGDGAGAGSSSGGGAGGAGTGAGTGSGGEGAGIGLGGGNQGGGNTGGSCAGDTQTAEPVPLDMYIMLDRSGSMLEATGVANVNKWDAVTTGLSSFFAAPESAGLGVGMQYFPLNKPGVPDSCTNSAQCGASGPCLLAFCDLEFAVLGSFTICDTGADCLIGGCADLGLCSGNQAYLCSNLGGQCTDNNGNNIGTCVDMTSSYCVDGVSCTVGDYATPAVPIGVLNGHAAALDANMSMQSPQGNTPTSAALQGAVDFAVAHKQANPGNAVVTVLATDGLPTECDPTDANSISNIAATAFNGNPSVPTFVIGVISPSDPTGQATMDQIAAAGGTNSAFIVDPNSNVTQAFVDALNAIRGNALACEYFVPLPEPPDTIDYGKVNVEHTPPMAASPNTIPYVGNEASCDPVDGGWYYDVDPAMGEPTKILVCPATCTLLQDGGELDIRVGCETVAAVPK